MAATKSFPILFLLTQLCGMSLGRLIGSRNLRAENVSRDGNDESDRPRRIFPKKLNKRQTITTAHTELKVIKESNELPKDPRIIGGSLSTKGRYPYAVSLDGAAGHFCGGSLIAKDVVLSAAHCAGSNYNVVVGRHALNIDEGEVIPVKEQVPHPQYKPSRTDNDFNLIFLSRPANADVVSLNSNSAAPTEGDSVTVMGWGDTGASSSYAQLSNTLREVEVKVLSNQKCAQSKGNVGGSYNSYAGSITGNMLCAKDLGEDSCQGDSGGPLVMKGSGGSADVQVGVVSWGIGCANEIFPGVYARVSSVYDWIRNEVCKRSSDPPDDFGCSSTTSEAAVCEPFSFDLRTDGHASETSWKLEKIEGNVASSVGSGPPQAAVYADNTYYQGAAYGCLPPGRYRFTMKDSYGDGIIGSGYYRIILNGEVLALSSSFGPNESTEFVVSSTTTDDTILEEDFTFGYGQFNAGGKDVLHYPNVLDRNGVARLESGNGIESSIYSNEMSLTNKSYAEIKVTFSFYGNSMEFDEQFCVDYMVNNVQNWAEVKCFASGSDFVNSQWYDNVTASIELQTGNNIDSMRVRFRCDANSIHDDILIDQVKITGVT
mmetsp:Transcript_43989/g.78955  ORF Transcript_43989/g.78955 Transcript_43989/m.78955 type:complete len:600 (+) Transcript_43989:48-1847(+)